MSMVSLFLDATISCKMSLFITSVASNIWSISLGVLQFLVLLLVVMKSFLVLVVMKGFLLLLILEFLPSVNCESLTFSCSHILLSYHNSSFFLCTFFSDSSERDQPPYCTNPLNECQFSWSKETIQVSHHNLSFFEILFNRFSCSLIWTTLVK